MHRIPAVAPFYHTFATAHSAFVGYAGILPDRRRRRSGGLRRGAYARLVMRCRVHGFLRFGGSRAGG